jgi:hypothetical protein
MVRGRGVSPARGASARFQAGGFRRSAISAESRHRASTAGANFDFSGGKIRLTANYVSRKIGEPGVRRGTLIGQAQVKF